MKQRFEFPGLLQAFFTDRLMSQKQASAHTVASYRDTFRLLIEYVHERLKKEPANIRIADLNTDFVMSFLNHLEEKRGVSARSRNQRLGAIRSFFRYVAFKAPEHSGLVQQILAIPSKRHDHTLVDFLTREEIEAILEKPDRNTWLGRRDHALILLAVQTGMRVSELTGLCRRDLAIEKAAHVRCLGKGRKDRCIPLTKTTTAVLRSWSKEVPASPETPFFPNSQGGHANLAMKEGILKMMTPVEANRRRFRADDALLSFLRGL